MKNYNQLFSDFLLLSSFRFTFLSVVLTLLISCGDSASIPSKPKIPDYYFDYTFPVRNIEDFNCQGIVEEKIGEISVIEKRMLNMFASKMTLDKIEEQSISSHHKLTESFEVVENASSRRLRKILRDLVEVVEGYGMTHPTLNVFLVKSKIDFSLANAWTTGSYIYISEPLYNLCELDSELAIVIARELSHIICQHISYTPQREELFTNILGQTLGKSVAKIYEKTIANGLGQRIEIQADINSLLLVYETGLYDPADAMKIFGKIAELEDSNALLIEKITDREPITDIRLNCIAGIIAKAKNKAAEIQSKGVYTSR